MSKQYNYEKQCWRKASQVKYYHVLVYWTFKTCIYFIVSTSSLQNFRVISSIKYKNITWDWKYSVAPYCLQMWKIHLLLFVVNKKYEAINKEDWVPSAKQHLGNGSFPTIPSCGENLVENSLKLTTLVKTNVNLFPKSFVYYLL